MPRYKITKRFKPIDLKFSINLWYTYYVNPRELEVLFAKIQQHLCSPKEQIAEIVPGSSSTSEDRNIPIVTVADDVELPIGMTIGDIEDAVKRAQQHVGFHYSQPVSLSRYVFDQGVRIGGIARPSYSKESEFFVNIELSVEEARLRASQESEPGFSAGAAREQLWATAFEEAFHAAKIQLGQFDNDLSYQLTSNTSELEYLKYLNLPEERIVDDALNGGILENKFGKNTVYQCKRVLHPKEAFPPSLEQIG